MKYIEEKSNSADTTYTLPDKKVLAISGAVRMKVPELLFKPALNNFKCKSLHTMTWASVQSCDIDIRRELGRNLILSGGSTMFECLNERLNAEILNLAPAGTEIRLLYNVDKRHAVWNGTSTFASLSSME